MSELKNLRIAERTDGSVAFEFDPAQIVGTSKQAPKLTNKGEAVGNIVNGQFVPTMKGGNPVVASSGGFHTFEVAGKKYKANVHVMPA